MNINQVTLIIILLDELSNYHLLHIRKYESSHISILCRMIPVKFSECKILLVLLIKPHYLMEI